MAVGLGFVGLGLWGFGSGMGWGGGFGMGFGAGMECGAVGLELWVLGAVPGVFGFGLCALRWVLRSSPAVGGLRLWVWDGVGGWGFWAGGLGLGWDGGVWGWVLGLGWGGGL